MRAIILKENAKPLQVSKDFVLNYDKRERGRMEKLSDHVDRHISTLKTIRDKVESRHETMTRSSAYRVWKRDFTPKKQAVLLGQTMNSMEGKVTGGLTGLTHSDEEVSTARPNKDLSNVLDSLQKLSELENRISSLERENGAHDKPTESLTSPLLPSRIQFKKTKVAPYTRGAPPGGTAYTVRTKATMLRPAVRNGRTFVPVKLSKAKATTVGHSSRGVFITEYDANESTKAFNRTEGDDQARLR